MSVLTLDEIGAEQYAKAHNDKMRFRGAPGSARQYAVDRGRIAVSHLDALTRSLADSTYSEDARNRFCLDAEMFARHAFRGWRAYRIMKGE